MYKHDYRIVLLSLLLCAVSQCNGRKEYCELAFNQFTFPGTHNSGAGFNGPMRRCRTGSVEDPCVWRNQNLNISAQLQLGIRFLTIDPCILPDDCVTDVYDDAINESRLMTCQGGVRLTPYGGYRFGGLMIQVLNQINDWMEMEKNRNEVIGLRFTWNFFPKDQREMIVRELIDLLETKWYSQLNDSDICSNCSGSNITLNSQYNRTGTWPTLSQAIESNSRLFVFLDDRLSVTEELKRVWMNPPPISMSSFMQPTWSSILCYRIYESIQYCNTSSELVSADGFIPVGICNDHAQLDCNGRLENVTKECYSMRQQYNQTVNVILVNYPEQATSPNTVIDVAEKLNFINVEIYLNYSISTATAQFDATSGGRNVLSSTTTSLIVMVVALKLMSV